MECLKVTRILALSALLATNSVSYAGNSIGNYISHIPIEEKALHGLSEDEWERIAGGEVDDGIGEQDLQTADSKSQAGRKSQIIPSKYSCLLPVGSIAAGINQVAVCSGYKNAIWMLPDFKVESEIPFRGDAPEALLQAVIDYFDIEGIAVVHANKVVAFKEP